MFYIGRYQNQYKEPNVSYWLNIMMVSTKFGILANFDNTDKAMIVIFVFEKKKDV